jgi:hypothetical protein
LLGRYFSFVEKKSKQKKPPAFRFALRVAEATGAHGSSPAWRRAQTVHALFPAATSMLGAERREVDQPADRVS